jgi:hypothetical protein
MVKDISIYMNTKTQGIQDYKVFLNMLDQYEELNLEQYIDGDVTQKIFSHTPEGQESTKEKVSSLCDQLKNPYVYLYHWAKGELFDIEAVQLALKTKDNFS